MTSTNRITTGRMLLTLNALSSSVGAFIADFNETHVYNPRWPPHARFHNGQTMSMAACLGLATLYYTWRASPAPSRDSAATATVFASLYWITALSGVLYPGAKAMDPEFGEGFPQLFPFLTALFVGWLGGALEMRRLGAAAGSGSGGGKRA